MYASLDAVKAELSIDATDDRRDDQLIAAITAASAAIDNYCHRTFGRTGTEASPTSRVYDTAGGTAVIDDLVDLASADSENGDAWDAVDVSTLVLLPRNAAADGRPYTMIRTRSGCSLPTVLRLAGTWGWAEVPAAIVEATVIEAVSILTAKAAPSGVDGGDPLLSMVRAPGDMHPKARHLASAYQRAGIG